MRILMVCLGNICRSPMAEGVLRHLARERGLSITTDSAGTGDYHVGEAPDHRAQAAMRRQGLDISDLRARQFTPEDFDRFDLLLAMDGDNLRNMLRLAPSPAHAAKARLIMDHAPGNPLREVPDPYFGGEEGFDAVHEMLLEACTNLLNDVRR
ncbi:MAG: low molecular weight protein-tyrosine-phosphatase [Flavobacteriales bacterium]|jgi:protein-tyrosine phosphatase|nr:MAG: low molecular weight protein-tyrosine-phosphatase [Flavobacteriales bacterium]